ncbi:type ISP restriction/modification enzyme [Symbiopectobacterium purcellii]|uniref:Type ISP restriction-modification enzyme LLaBIII C-terminal specificity domain-containing protein n=1 Tax=Symbiopectobacterium purcellii TaxID=2871826 RepID=A0ABX9AHU2_9ENTR|nr:type ISP restriction/modification enzyme [Symbiopectobacterium purcellii]QZN94617.1 hypothetical protein K6K13_15140 [Symbiopectobacterium purcellii]
MSTGPSINGIEKVHGWQVITPDSNNDWLNQRDDSFSDFIEIGNKKDKSSVSIFVNFSQGILTTRDSWCYQYSKKSLETNIMKLIATYNRDRGRLTGLSNINDKDLSGFIDNNPENISWTANLKESLRKGKVIDLNPDNIRMSMYRPYTKSWLYFNRQLNERVYQIPQIFPEKDSDNLVICVIGRGATKKFSAIIVNTIPDYEMISKGQCFPLYIYDDSEPSSKTEDLFYKSQCSKSFNKVSRRDAISDFGLMHFCNFYNEKSISKLDVFYYTHALLNNKNYIDRYIDNLSKELPRIPCVKKYEDFLSYAKAGRDLADLHLNYETVEPYKATIDTGSLLYSQ